MNSCILDQINDRTANFDGFYNTTTGQNNAKNGKQHKGNFR